MNNQIFFFFYNLAHQNTFFDNLIIFLAVYFPYVVVILSGLFLFFYKKWKEIVLIFFSSFLAYFISAILKILFHTLRPFLALLNVHSLFFESGFAFPSGHATFFSALAFSIFFTNKKAGYVFMFFALLIGLARVIAGVHFPIDILSGFIISFLIAYSVAYFRKSV